MTVRDVISIFRYGEKMVDVGIAPDESVFVDENNKALLELVGDIVVGQIYVSDNTLHLEPLISQTVVKERPQPHGLEALK